MIHTSEEFYFKIKKWNFTVLFLFFSIKVIKLKVSSNILVQNLIKIKLYVKIPPRFKELKRKHKNNFNNY